MNFISVHHVPMQNRKQTLQISQNGFSECAQNQRASGTMSKMLQTTYKIPSFFLTFIGDARVPRCLVYHWTLYLSTDRFHIWRALYPIPVRRHTSSGLSLHKSHHLPRPTSAACGFQASCTTSRATGERLQQPQHVCLHSVTSERVQHTLISKNSGQ